MPPGKNLIYEPAQLYDFVTLILPIPVSLRTNILTILVSIIVVGTALLLACKILWRHSRCAPFVLITYGIFGVLLTSFYGVYFGGPDHPIPRYLSVLSPVLALLGITAAYRVLVSMRNDLRQMVVRPIAALSVILVVGLNARFYRNGLEHENEHYFKVVDWVEANVPPEIFIGVFDSGNAGFLS